MFKIIVCVKAVPDPREAENIKIDPATKTLTRGDIPLVINTLDKNAMEAALRFKEELGAQVTVLSMGPPGAGNIVKECLALGADQGVLMSDRAFAGADAYATAFALARGIEKLGACDLVLCGMASTDGSTEWVGPEISVFLNMPVVTMVQEIVEYGGAWWKVKASLENGYRLMQVRLPAVFTVTRDLNAPRILNFSGIIKARKKEITRWDSAALEIPEVSLGLKGSPTYVSKMAVTESKREVEIISGEREEKAAKLIRKLVDRGVL